VPSSCAMCHSYHLPAGQWAPGAKDREPHYVPVPPPPVKTQVAAIAGRARK
jgi:hypothetical protein